MTPNPSVKRTVSRQRFAPPSAGRLPPTLGCFDAMLPENFISLHKHEEQIRVESLHLFEAHQNLSDHLAMIHGSMAMIYALAHDHANATDDELTIQYLGLRAFNSAAASMKLGLSGYYQSAFSIVRDIFETVALVDYLFHLHIISAVITASQ